MKTARIVAVACAAVFLVVQPSKVEAAEQTSCVTCHGDVDLFGEDMAGMVSSWQQGVHADVGLGCQDCHGGNPDPELSEDA